MVSAGFIFEVCLLGARLSELTLSGHRVEEPLGLSEWVCLT